MKPINKLAIIGVGLIGGSFGLAVRRGRLAKEVVGVARHRGTLLRARKLGAIDRGIEDLREAVRGADVVMLATPVRAMPRLVKRMCSVLKPGTILTDVGSTKAELVTELDRLLKGCADFVGAHPLAGSEHWGVEHADVDLFRGRLCFVTPSTRTSVRATRFVKRLWRALGASVHELTPQQHDRLVAHISHLPHVVAVAVMNAVSVRDLKSAGTGFQDTTRVAGGNPGMWRDVCLTNTGPLTQAIDSVIEALGRLRRQLAEGDSAGLMRELQKAQRRREQLTRSG